MQPPSIVLALRWSLLEALGARLLFCLMHAHLYHTLSASGYAHISVLLGIVYGLLSVADLGFADTISATLRLGTTSTHACTHVLLIPYLYALSSLTLTTLTCLILTHTPPALTLITLSLTLSEYTKRVTRTSLTLLGHPRTVALTELTTYALTLLACHIIPLTLTRTLIIMLVASTTSLTHLLPLLITHYHTLPHTRTTITMRTITTQRLACMLTALSTSGLHTLILPLIARTLPSTHAATLTYTNTIISALTSLTDKLITSASIITFFHHPTHQATRLRIIMRTAVACWLALLSIITMTAACWHPSNAHTTILLFVFYATNSCHLPLKYLMTARTQAGTYLIITALRTSLSALSVYAAITGYLTYRHALGLIALMGVMSVTATYLHAQQMLAKANDDNTKQE